MQPSCSVGTFSPRPVLVEFVRSHGQRLVADASITVTAVQTAPAAARPICLAITGGRSLRRARHSAGVHRQRMPHVRPRPALRTVHPRIASVLDPQHPQVRQRIDPMPERTVAHLGTAEDVTQHSHHGPGARVPYRRQDRQRRSERVARHDDVAEVLSAAQVVQQTKDAVLQPRVEVGVEVRREHCAVLAVGRHEVERSLALGPILPLVLPRLDVPIPDRLGLVGGRAPPSDHELPAAVRVEDGRLDAVVGGLVSSDTGVVLRLFLVAWSVVRIILLSILAGAAQLVEEALHDHVVGRAEDGGDDGTVGRLDEHSSRNGSIRCHNIASVLFVIVVAAAATATAAVRGAHDDGPIHEALQPHPAPSDQRSKIEILIDHSVGIHDGASSGVDQEHISRDDLRLMRDRIGLGGTHRRYNRRGFVGARRGEGGRRGSERELMGETGIGGQEGQAGDGAAATAAAAAVVGWHRGRGR
mmetsp:Transcript_45579/g.84475  ORF Transcript_45579/g.84475 Transcript_45579/m.84475 type:complete len:472 (+) Transcript_45579:323-1738(+)